MPSLSSTLALIVQLHSDTKIHFLHGLHPPSNDIHISCKQFYKNSFVCTIFRANPMYNSYHMNAATMIISVFDHFCKTRFIFDCSVIWMKIWHNRILQDLVVEACCIRKIIQHVVKVEPSLIIRKCRTRKMCWNYFTVICLVKRDRETGLLN